MPKVTVPIIVVLFALCAPAQESRPTSRPSSKPAAKRTRDDWRNRLRSTDWGADAPGRAVMPKKLMPITKSPYSTPQNMKNPVADNDLVIGIFQNGRARAYPIKMLGGPQREIINDTLGREAYVVNW